MLSPLLAFSYIFSPPTYHRAVIIVRDWTRYNKKHFSHWMKLTIWINHKIDSIINQVFINNKQSHVTKFHDAENMKQNADY
jgi:hypothetical protein